MLTVLFDRTSAKWTLSAVERLGRETGRWISVDSGENQLDLSLDNLPVVGLIAAFGRANTTGFLDTLVTLWSQGARRFVLFAPEGGSDPRPWQVLPALHRGALEKAVTTCDRADRGALIEAISKAERNTLPEWAKTRLRETVEARRLHSKVRWFSHGASSDLTNQFLAPARLLLMAPADDEALAGFIPLWRTEWEKFNRKVVTAVKEGVTRFGQLGDELVSAADPIDRWLLTEPSEKCTALDLDRMMALLTECRVAAGEATTQERGQAGEGPGVPPLGNEAWLASRDQVFRVLVVDDHAAAWWPVFAELQRRLEVCDGARIIFEFSEDAQKVCVSDTGRKANIHFGYYDLVVLDVFLGFSKDGLNQDGRELLRRIRDSLVNLPVLLWTTSRDDEITRKATRANGVLLKKTVIWEELEETLRVWLPKGRATAAFSLPSAFFNQVIWDKKDRELVRDLTDWGLKQLDSFHALDGKFFRFFTDHGGRHIVKLLELLEQALQPFLRNQSVAVLSDDSETREFELLALYLSVVCHELGMFPMRLNGAHEVFGEANPNYLHDVRSLHALRAMILLEDCIGDPNGGRYWNDDDGRRLGLQLKRTSQKAPAIAIGEWMAAIVGYHARCLSSLREPGFLDWTADERFARLKSPINTLPRMDHEFRETLGRLKAKFTDDDARGRLRRQCALFRFVDAIDIAASRNPALFLIHGMHRDAENNREYLKRQICEDVRLERGQVHFKAAALCPGGSELGPILAQLPGLLQEDLREACGDYSTRLLKDAEMVHDPWRLVNQPGNPLPFEDPKLIGAKALQKGLDLWLEKTWKVLMGDPMDQSFARHLTALNVVVAGRDGFLRATSDGKSLIASITALSVALEVQDEYRAILEAGLAAEHEGIRLATFEWCLPDTWSAGPPEGLTILRDGLAQYPLPALPVETMP